MLIPFHFVFQGGGAKLGALIAAAEAIYKNAGPMGYEIRTVSGTSAGAIVACILATGHDPALFRNKIKEIAPDYLDKIIVKRSLVRNIWRAVRGNPIYSTSDYLEFLRKLFQTATSRPFVTLADLDAKIGLYIHAADIREGSPKNSKPGDRGDIAELLMESSGIPFVFNTYSDKSAVVDGGLIDNFPSSTISEIIEGEDPRVSGYVVGVSFESPPGTKYKNFDLADYIRALISTVIDVPVKRSIKKLKDQEVHFIKSTTGTFEFRKALEEDLEDKTYNGLMRDTENFLTKLMLRKYLESAQLRPEALIDRISELHETVSHRQRVKIKKITIKATCECLRLPPALFDQRQDIVDEMEIITEITVGKEPVLTFGMGFTMDSRYVDIGNVSVRVKGPDKQPIGTTVFPLPPKIKRPIATGTMIANNLMIFFHEPLKSGNYRLELKTAMRGILNFEKDERRSDDLAYQNLRYDHVDAVEMVIYIPDTVADPSFSDLPKDKRPKGLKWAPGKPMTDAELTRHTSPPPQFKVFGWKARDIANGMAMGFRVNPSN